MLTAKEIMNVDFAAITPDAKLGYAIERALATDPEGLMVVDRLGKLAGVITDFALLAGVYDASIQHESVADHMTPRVHTVEETTTLREMADLMILHRVHQLPVVQDEMIVGVVTRRRVLEASCQELATA